jgi:hypothetical protein
VTRRYQGLRRFIGSIKPAGGPWARPARIKARGRAAWLYSLHATSWCVTNLGLVQD